MSAVVDVTDGSVIVELLKIPAVRPETKVFGKLRAGVDTPEEVLTTPGKPDP